MHGGRSSSRPTTIPSAPRLSPTKLQRANSEPVKPTPTSPPPPPAPVPVASTTPGAWACAGCGFDENEPDLHYCRRCARIRKAGGASPLRREGSGREEEEVQVNSAAAGEHCDGTQEAAMIRAALKAGLHSWLMCGGIEAIRDTLFRQRGGVGRLLSAEAMLSGIQDRFFPISTSRFLGACIHGDHLSTCAAHIKTLITWATGHGRTIIS